MDGKAKSKTKAIRLKPKKESGAHLDVDLLEKNRKRSAAVDVPSPKIVQGTKSEKVVCPRNAMPTPSTPAAIAGGDSGAALIALDTGQSEPVAPERGNWTGRFDFLFSLLGYSVGLGNVWRFPYLCYNNGGGAFLIPFSVMLVIAGLPLMFMELSFGQYAALGPVAIYHRFCPVFRGLGYGMIIVSAVVMLYYNIIIAWTIFYFFASLRLRLPWQNCEPEWSTLNCFSYEMADQCDVQNGTFYLRECYNLTYAEEHNITEVAIHALKRPPAEEYFNNYVLGLSSGIEETGNVRLSLALCLFVAWVIVFLCLCKGVQSSGKVVYFTALFPYVVLVILFFRGVTLPGAYTGIRFYLTPDFNQLANAQVWGDAAVQIFFALSPAWGGLITLSSYNKFSNNCYKDSLIVAVCNIGTSFFAGFVIFSIIGFLAHELDVEVEKVVDQGAGLAFIVYPEVVTRLPISPVWSVLFFVMLLTLGLDSQFALMETVTTAILDRFPNLRQYKTWVVLFVAILGYIGGLVFTTNAGMYWLQLMDKYAANWSVLLIAISECVLIAWIYGSQRFLNDIQGMIGKRSRAWNLFWSTMWRFITPATLLFILFFNWVEYKPASYGHYVYPLWADAVGWIVGLLPVAVILIIALHQIYKAPLHLSYKERLKYLLRPTAEWGPAGRPCVNLHAERYQSDNFDGNVNTQILINGLPSDVSPYEDTTGNVEEAIHRVPASLSGGDDIPTVAMKGTNGENGHKKIMHTFSGGKKDTEACADCTILLEGSKPPASGGILKSSKKLLTSSNGKQKSPPSDISPSKQPLIQTEIRANVSVGSFLNEVAKSSVARDRQIEVEKTEVIALDSSHIQMKTFSDKNAPPTDTKNEKNLATFEPPPKTVNSTAKEAPPMRSSIKGSAKAPSKMIDNTFSETSMKSAGNGQKLLPQESAKSKFNQEIPTGKGLHGDASVARSIMSPTCGKVGTVPRQSSATALERPTTFSASLISHPSTSQAAKLGKMQPSSSASQTGANENSTSTAAATTATTFKATKKEKKN